MSTAQLSLFSTRMHDGVALHAEPGPRKACEHPPLFLRSLPRPHCINCLKNVSRPSAAYRKAEDARIRGYVEEQAKKRGLATSAAAHHTDLRIAREIARELGADGSQVWADRVRVVLAERHPDITPGNWLGALFRGKEWEPVGFVKSQTPGSHSNRLLKWRRNQ